MPSEPSASEIDAVIRDLADQSFSDRTPHGEKPWRLAITPVTLVAFGLVIAASAQYMSVPLFLHILIPVCGLAFALAGVSLLAFGIYDQRKLAWRQLFDINIMVAAGHDHDRHRISLMAERHPVAPMRSAINRLEGWVKGYEARVAGIGTLIRPLHLAASVGISFLFMGNEFLIKQGLSPWMGICCAIAWLVLVFFSLRTALTRSHTYWMMAILKEAVSLAKARSSHPSGGRPLI